MLTLGPTFSTRLKLITVAKSDDNLLFIDLRDNYGLTQCVIDKSNPIFSDLEKLPLETVTKIQGTFLVLNPNLLSEITPSIL